jgi:hypothetical protein
MPVITGQRKKKCAVIVFMLVLLSSVAIATLFVNLAKANPYLSDEFISPPRDSKPPTISLNPLINNTVYTSNIISLTINVSIPEPTAKYSLHLHSIQYQTDWKDSLTSVYEYPPGSGLTITDFSGNLTLAEVPDGSHNVTFIANVDGGYAVGLTWYWFYMKSYLNVFFSVDTVSPSVSILSIENRTYEVSDVALDFTVNEQVTKTSYSLDGQSNVTVAGNTTLSGLTVGEHNVTVYAWDVAGNVGASETMPFTIFEPEPFVVAPVVAASIAVVASVSAGILVYFKKLKH